MIGYLKLEKSMSPDENPDVVYKDKIKKKSEHPKGVLPLIIKSGVPILLLTYTIQSLLNLGLKSLAPTMLMENYAGMTPATANRLNIILVLSSSFGLFCSRIPIFKKFCETTSIAIMFGVTVPLLLVITFIGRVELAVIIAMLALLMVSVSSMTVFFQYVSKAFEKFGLGATLAGLFNCMSAIGIVLATYVFATLADKYGWGVTTKSWLVIAIVSLALSALTVPLWKRFKKKMDI
jgi:fucose permease